MNRLANALLFAVVVIGAYALDARPHWSQSVPGRLMAHVAGVLHTPDLPMEAMAEPQAIPEPPDFAYVMERAQRGQEDLARAERVEARVRARMERGAHGCKVVVLDK